MNMKKKLVKVLALCMALLLLSGMTVFAAESSNTGNTAANATASENAATASEAYASGVTAAPVTFNGQTLTPTISTVSSAIVSEASQQAKGLVSESASLLKVFDLSLPEGDYSAGVQVTMNIPNVTAGQKIAVLHQKADGTWESLKVNDVSNGTVTATFTSFSPVAIVAYDGSPKTGNTFPAAIAVAGLALAGAVVCCKKYRFSE